LFAAGWAVSLVSVVAALSPLFVATAPPVVSITSAAATPGAAFNEDGSGVPSGAGIAFANALVTCADVAGKGNFLCGPAGTGWAAADADTVAVAVADADAAVVGGVVSAAVVVGVGAGAGAADAAGRFSEKLCAELLAAFWDTGFGRPLLPATKEMLLLFIFILLN
jgi:hypothetical protein